jgi:hypothetical protein
MIRLMTTGCTPVVRLPIDRRGITSFKAKRYRYVNIGGAGCATF